jgi:hypothetical protein
MFLDVKVYSDIMNFNFTGKTVTQEVNLKCIVFETKQPCVL